MDDKGRLMIKIIYNKNMKFIFALLFVIVGFVALLIMFPWLILILLIIVGFVMMSED